MRTRFCNTCSVCIETNDAYIYASRTALTRELQRTALLQRRLWCAALCCCHAAPDRASDAFEQVAGHLFEGNWAAASAADVVGTPSSRLCMLLSLSVVDGFRMH